MKYEEATKFKEFVQPHYEEKDTAHDFNHILRILRRVESWIDEASPRLDKDKLAFIACFHGLIAKLRNDETFKKETIEFLISQGWTEKKIDDGFVSLYRHTREPQTIEEKLVHDANSYSRMGALGIAKAFMTGGARGQTFIETADIFEYDFLDKTMFYTPMAQKQSKDEIKYAKSFLKKLRKELEYNG